MNLEIYKPHIWMKRKSFFIVNSEWAKTKPEDLPDTPIVKAFLADNEIQEIRIASTNMGFIYEFQKRYKEQGE